MTCLDAGGALRHIAAAGPARGPAALVSSNHASPGAVPLCAFDERGQTGRHGV